MSAGYVLINQNKIIDKICELYPDLEGQCTYYPENYASKYPANDMDVVLADLMSHIWGADAQDKRLRPALQMLLSSIINGYNLAEYKIKERW